MARQNEDGKCIVTLKYPHLFPVMNFASNPKTREAMDLANAKKVNEENTPLLEKVLLLRRSTSLLFASLPRIPGVPFASVPLHSMIMLLTLLKRRQSCWAIRTMPVSFSKREWQRRTTR